ncbi:MAG: DUF6516 family protein [Anaerolineae bacterium]
MLAVYQTLISLAQREFNDVVTQTKFIGGTLASPNKLRLLITDGSFLDIWLSADGDYSYHWERRGQTGEIYRWDNAPHHAQVSTFPDHFHKGDEQTVIKSDLSPTPEMALRKILEFVRVELVA